MPDGGRYVECPRCDGEGGWYEDRFTPSAGHWTVDVPCHDCHGEREVWSEFATDDEDDQDDDEGLDGGE